MKAYEATYTKNGSGPVVVLVGASGLRAAAVKAEEALTENSSYPKDSLKGAELVKIELTDKVII